MCRLRMSSHKEETSMWITVSAHAKPIATYTAHSKLDFSVACLTVVPGFPNLAVLLHRL